MKGQNYCPHSWQLKADRDAFKSYVYLSFYRVLTIIHIITTKSIFPCCNQSGSSISPNINIKVRLPVNIYQKTFIWSHHSLSFLKTRLMGTTMFTFVVFLSSYRSISFHNLASSFFITQHFLSMSFIIAWILSPEGGVQRKALWYACL